MATPWKGMRRTNLHGDFHEMEIISGQLFSVAVHVDSDPEFRAYILAAGTAHAQGNETIDNTLRRHKNEWIRKFEEEETLKPGGVGALYQNIASEVSQRCKAISALDLRTASTSGAIASANTQIRLASTFRGALLLIRDGYPFESEAVIRLGLEQVAWTYGVRNLKTVEEVENTSGTGWMTPLKAIFPGAGRFYNRLTKLAHMAPATHQRFLGIEESRTHVKLQMPVAALESLVFLITLLDAFLVVSEKCLGSAGLACQNIDPSSGSLLEKRVASELIHNFEAALPASSAAFFRSWWK